MSIGLSLYLASARRSHRPQDADAAAPKGVTRPEGPLIWFHRSATGARTGFQAIAAGICEEYGQVASLLTGPLDEPTPADSHSAETPADTPQAAAAFLDLWQPDLIVWSGPALRPAILAEAAERAIPMLMIDVGGPARLDLPWRGPGVLRPLLRHFYRILTTDAATRKRLVQQGADPDRCQSVGRRQPGAEPPPCEEEERAALAIRLAARPVWFAAGVTEAEDTHVLAAQQAASRMAHRLLLILQPTPLDRGPALAKALAEQGRPVALRSRGDTPEEETQILIADTPAEAGLWLRLAPLTLIGGTFSGPADKASPLEAAAVGSAILHGPQTGPYAGLYDHMGRADAARLVQKPEDLGTHVEALLAPDRAAALAHAAWGVSSGGAEATDTIVAAAVDALETGGVV